MSDGDIVYRGYWWLPEAEADKQPGFLTINGAGRAVLELIDGFDSAIYQSPTPGVRMYSGRHRTFPMIYGLAGGTRITLLDVHRISGGSILSNHNQNLSVTRVLVDLHLDEPGEACFVGADVELDYLLQWSQLSAYNVTMTLTGGNQGSVRSVAASTSPGSLTVDWGDYTFTLFLRAGTLTSRVTGRNERVTSGRESASLLIQSKQPEPPDVFDRLINTFQDLLTLSFDHPSAIRSVHFRLPIDPHEPRPRTFRSYRRYIYSADAIPFTERYLSEFFVLNRTQAVDDGQENPPLAAVKFDEVVPRWFDLDAKTPDSTGLVFSSHYMDEGYVGAQLMTLCAGMEALHREVFGGKENYRARITNLLSRADPHAVEQLIGRPESWVPLVMKGRNALAHGDTSKDSLPEDLQAWLLLVSRTLCELVLAQELGISAEVQRDFVKRSPVVSHISRSYKEAAELYEAAHAEAAAAMEVDSVQEAADATDD